jgi:hypothetical protein
MTIELFLKTLLLFVLGVVTAFLIYFLWDGLTKNHATA